MKSHLPSYLHYIYTTLFSRRFFAIVGSSFIVTAGSILGFFLCIFGFFIASGGSLFSGSFGNGGFIMGIIILGILMILARGWCAIIVPIRSIDESKKLHFSADWKLFRKYISIYIAYTFWYSLYFFLVCLFSIFFLILFSALYEPLGWIFGVCVFLGILYSIIRLTFSWYHMLSEGSGSLKTMRESLKLTKKKFIRFFLTISGLAIIVWTLSFTIEILLIQALSLLGSFEILDSIVSWSRAYRLDSDMMLRGILDILGESPAKLSGSLSVFILFVSLSSVLSGAIFHTFFVQYYLHKREEYDMETSFLKAILHKHHHH